MNADSQSARTAPRSRLGPARNYLTQVCAVAAAEVTKLRHDPIELFSRAVQPILWLLLFG